MILLLFIIGVALIFGIARYCQSNTLFWTLLFSYVIGFAGMKIVMETVGKNEQSNVKVVSVHSTQLPITHCSTVYPFMCLNNVLEEPKKVTDSNTVSRYCALLKTKNVTLSEVIGKIRDQPVLTLIKPPELCLTKNFLTLHDSG